MISNLRLSKKFTLIELIIIVAIIGILASLLLPKLSKARDIAKLTVCLSNTKQFGVATQLYVVNNNYKMARGAAGADYVKTFGQYSRGIPFVAVAEYLGLKPIYPGVCNDTTITAYLKTSNIFRCPGKKYENNWLLDYVVNSLHFEYYYTRKSFQESGYSSFADEVAWPTKYIANTSETILFGEGWRRPDLKFAYNSAQFFEPNHLPFKYGAPNISPYNRMIIYRDPAHVFKTTMTAFDGSGKILSLEYGGKWPDVHRLTGDWK